MRAQVSLQALHIAALSLSNPHPTPIYLSVSHPSGQVSLQALHIAALQGDLAVALGDRPPPVPPSVPPPAPPPPPPPAPAPVPVPAHGTAQQKAHSGNL